MQYVSAKCWLQHIRLHNVNPEDHIPNFLYLATGDLIPDCSFGHLPLIYDSGFVLDILFVSVFL
jgi:hypothetical protein